MIARHFNFFISISNIDLQQKKRGLTAFSAYGILSSQNENGAVPVFASERSAMFQITFSHGRHVKHSTVSVVNGPWRRMPLTGPVDSLRDFVVARGFVQPL